MGEFSHLDESGAARMVDVGGKAETVRRAVASGRVQMAERTLAQLRDRSLPKGDVFAVARLAAIMAAKRTSDLVPLCHPVPITAVRIEFELVAEGVEIRAEVSSTGRTGVEMEAMVATSMAALTIYDMCKAVDRAMVIERVQLEHKSGGRHGTFDRAGSGGAP